MIEIEWNAMLVRWMSIYLMLMNLEAFILFGVDKRRAIQNRWRISEAKLLLSAALGGSLGALAGMQLFHHKTRKPKFAIGIPLLLILHIIIGIWILM